jgi:hypothetical protein
MAFLADCPAAFDWLTGLTLQNICSFTGSSSFA